MFINGFLAYMQTKSVQKFITFSPELYQLTISKARRFGLSVAEYIRHLIVTDVREDVTDLPMVDKETDKSIGRALVDHKEGRFVRVKSDKELKEYLTSLKNSS